MFICHFQFHNILLVLMCIFVQKWIETFDRLVILYFTCNYISHCAWLASRQHQS